MSSGEATATGAALAQRVRGRDRAAVATALNLLEDRRPPARARATEMLVELAETSQGPAGHLLGITGPPGVGKSSLASALIQHWRARGQTVAVLAVDPSSPISGGALLGDRLRMLRPRPDGGVFIRSLAGRGEPGGLAAAVYPMSQVMLASHDIVLVETIGVGQSEFDVVTLTDTTVLVVQPASGDTIQFLKAGIVELPDLFVVNKADLEGPARRAASELTGSLPTVPAGDWQAPVLLVSATDGRGLPELADGLARHRAHLEASGQLATARRRQGVAWGIKRFALEFGRHGIAARGGEQSLQGWWEAQDGSPFAILDNLRQLHLAGWRPASGQ